MNGTYLNNQNALLQKLLIEFNIIFLYANLNQLFKLVNKSVVFSSISLLHKQKAITTSALRMCYLVLNFT